MRKLALLLSLLVLGALGLIACGGGDDDETTAASDPGANHRLSNEETIEQQGNEWAAAFAKAGPVTCRYMGQPACERANCERVHAPIKNCRPPSAEFRESFADATIERVVIEGHYATAEFSNGESVEFEGQKADQGDNQGDKTVEGSVWFITERWIKEASKEAASEP